jgi:hypothetical protein
MKSCEAENTERLKVTAMLISWKSIKPERLIVDNGVNITLLLLTVAGGREVRERVRTKE